MVRAFPIIGYAISDSVRTPLRLYLALLVIRVSLDGLNLDSTLAVSVQPERNGLIHESTKLNEWKGAPLTLELLERIRLILRGGSIVDWFRLALDDQEEVRRFLLVNGYDLRIKHDENRLLHMMERAARYLFDELEMTLHVDFNTINSVVAPFLAASYRGNDPDAQLKQRSACILLKVVHTINHFEARELRLNLPLRTVELFEVVEERVMGHLAAMSDAGFPIHQYVASRKSGRSTITKLLSKRKANATEILDRLRFRVIVDSQGDIPEVLAEMTQRFIPYNYVVPEESSNSIVRFADFLRIRKDLHRFAQQLQFAIDLEQQEPLSPAQNECSADDFRMINFVADLPVSVDQVLPSRNLHGSTQHGRVVYVSAEFQVFDRRTWEANEKNIAASHEAYKGRQRERVRKRLFDGLEALWVSQDK